MPTTASLTLQMVVGLVVQPDLPLAFEPSSVNFEEPFLDV